MNISWLLGAVIGCIAMMFLLSFRRKLLIILADITTIVGSGLICCLYFNKWGVLIGRFQQGFAFTTQKIVSQVYISEYCPETHVKNFSIVPILLLSTGTLFILLKKLGQYFFYTIIFFSSIAIVNEINIGMIVTSLILTILLPIIHIPIVYYRVPETIYWLLYNEKEHQAEKVGKEIYKKKLVKAILSRIKDNHVAEIQSNICLYLKDIFSKDSKYRKQQIKCVYFFMVLQFTGYDVVESYSYQFYSRQNYSPENISLLVQTSGLVAMQSIAFCYLLFIKIGVKWTYVSGNQMIPISLQLMAIAMQKTNSNLNFVGIYTVTFFFHLSIWPCSWMIVTEVLPSRLLCIPVCVFFILKIILTTLFATELKQESIHLFGVSFFFKNLGIFWVYSSFSCVYYFQSFYSPRNKRLDKSGCN